MASLARHGRFGNAVLQYIYLRCFARVHGFRFETPSWIGRALFALEDADLQGRLSTVVEDGFSVITREGRARDAPLDRGVARATHLHRRYGQSVFRLNAPALEPRESPMVWPFQQADLEGLFMAHGRALRPHRDFIRSILQPAPAIAARAEAWVRSLREGGRDLVGVHLRRGDFATANLTQHFELITPLSAYLRWLRALWPTLKRPRLVVCSDSPALADEFGRLAASHLGGRERVGGRAPRFEIADLVPPREEDMSAAGWGFASDAGFFGDWYLLTQCDAVAISNSTFSFAACLLNERAKHFARPTFDGPALVELDPWDAEPLLFEPRAASLPEDIARRLQRALSGATPSQWVPITTSLLKLYPKALARRGDACLRANGLRALLRELIDPEYYLRVERKYAWPVREG